jgi:hypothetical protein
MEKRIYILAVIFILFLIQISLAAITPYIKIGTMLTSPSADDFGFVDAEGGNLDEYLDLSKGNFGGGLQFLFGMPAGPQFGAEIGYQKLFSYTFDAGVSDLPYIQEDNWEGSEQDLYINGIVNYGFPASSVFVQGGAGFHIVFWEEQRNYQSDYTSDYEEDSGSGTNFGLFGAAGINIPLGTISMPLMIRLDYIMRYGSTITASAVVGLSF